MRRNGNIVTVNGNVVHSFQDVYDFHRDASFDLWWRGQRINYDRGNMETLEKAGMAKPFTAVSAWTEQVSMEIVLK
jgi:hypothetical protein